MDEVPKRKEWITSDINVKFTIFPDTQFMGSDIPARDLRRPALRSTHISNVDFR
jgi:hypothetical protein